MMKLLNLFLVFTIIVIIRADVTGELQKLEKKFNENIVTCKDKNGVTNDLLNKFGRKYEPTTDKTLNSFFVCILRNMELMTTENKFNEGTINKIMDLVEKKMIEDKIESEMIKKVNDVIKKCAAAQPEEKDELKAVNIAHQCLYENGKKMGIII